MATTRTWRYYAYAGLTRTVSNPFYVFRYDGARIERYYPGVGWIDTPSLLRFIVGKDDADPITPEAADALTDGHAADP